MRAAHRIRPATPSDLEVLGEIERAADQLFGEQASGENFETVDRDALITAMKDGLLFIAEQDAAVVGFAVSHERGSFLHLHQISVHPEFGRRGMGRGLVQSVIHACARRRLRGVTLTTFATIPWNGPFYRSMDSSI